MFYERLNETCKMRDIKLTPLLIKLGMSSGSTGKWKKGILPNSETLIKLAEALEVSTDYLLCKTDNPTPPNKKAPVIEDMTEALNVFLREKLGREPTQKDIELVDKFVDVLAQKVEKGEEK